MKRNWITLLLFFYLNPLDIYARDTLFYSKSKRDTVKKEFSETYEIFTVNEKGKVVGSVFSKKNILLNVTEYNNRKDLKEDGKSLGYDTLGNIRNETNYINGKKSGTFKTFYKNGMVKRIEIYDLDSLIKFNCYSSIGADTIYFPYEVMPQFPGGDNSFVKYIRNGVIYPKQARRKGMQDIIYVDFIINQQGLVEDAKIKSGKYELLNQEALRIVKSMPAWIPGKQDGEPAKVQYTFPIKFTLR